MLSRLITRREQFVVVFLAAAAIVGAVALYVSGTRDAALRDALVVDSRPEMRDGAAADEGISESAEVESQPKPIRDEVTVSLVGAVGRPGVYTLDAGTRIQDLVGSAGGLLRSADTSDVNLAAKLIDGTTLIIPRKVVHDDAGIELESESPGLRNIPEYTISGWRSGPSEDAIAVLGTSGPLMDLNRATQADLESLPGIGPKLAEEIIRYRKNSRFAAVSDIMNVSGIGQKRYEAIMGLVTVR